MTTSSWWHRSQPDGSIVILSSSTSLPSVSGIKELDTESLCQDLEDSSMRTRHISEPILSSLDADEGEPIGNVTDPRGVKYLVMEKTPDLSPPSRSSSRPASRSLRIRKSLSLLFRSDNEVESEGNEDDNSKESTHNAPKTLNNTTSNAVDLFHQPFSRLGLLDHYQFSMFKFELNMMKRVIPDFPLPLVWNIWIQEESLEQLVKVSSFLALRQELKSIQKQIDKLPRFFLFRDNITPLRKDKLIAGGGRLDFKVQLDEFKFFIVVSQLIAEGHLYQPDCVLVACGTQWKRKSNYGVVSIWLHPPQQRYDEEMKYDFSILSDYLSVLKVCLAGEYHKYLANVFLVVNETGKYYHIPYDQ